MLNPKREEGCSSSSCSSQQSWNLCRSLCPAQTCNAMGSSDAEKILLDDCLMGNVMKTYRSMSSIPPSHPIDTVRWVKENVCLSKSHGYTFSGGVQRGLVNMDFVGARVEQAAAFAASRPSTFDLPGPVRTDCGFPGITEQSCTQKGCLFDNSNPTVPNCFFSLARLPQASVTTGLIACHIAMLFS